jgi:hypothetical protein
MKGLEKIAFACSGDHLSFENTFVELQIDFLCQRTNVADIDAVLMKKFLDSLTVYKEDSGVVKHFRQR